MANNRKQKSKGVNVFKIVLGMLKETAIFLFAIAIGIIDIVATVFD